MSRVLAPTPVIDLQAFTHLLRSEQCFALGVAVFIHLLMMTLLLAGWQENKPVAAAVNTIKIQMIQAPVVSPVSEDVVVQPPEPPVLEKPPVKKEPPVQAINEAEFAKKRVDEPKMTAVDSAPDKTEETEVPRIEEAPAPVAAQQTASQVSTNAESTTSTASDAPTNQPFDSSQYFPVQKDAPAYPTRALDKGIQGACTVRYTVNTEGRVENPQVLDDCHPFFIKPSLTATKSFRYTPRIVDGKAVNVPNVKNTFQYRIE
ncbi:MAG: energy transducer TonB [Methylophilaceae bacterium]|jgi:periplasmic protein TonB|nr:MAG: energy transducer TonB [Methylophilaceae bacterium]